MARDIDPSDLIALDKAQAKSAAAQRLARSVEVEDFKWLMGNKQGRRFVWRLLEKAGVFRTTFRLNNEMAFLEGMRNMGLILVADIHEICPEKYHIMVKEADDNAKRTREQQ